MRHWLALLALVLAAGIADAASDPWVCRDIEGAKYCTWTSTGTDTSHPLFLAESATVHNSGSVAFDIGPCVPGGTTILHNWIATIEPGVNCGEGQPCGSVRLDAGFWCARSASEAASAYTVVPRKD